MANNKYTAKKEAERIVNAYAATAGATGWIPHACTWLIPLQYQMCDEIASVFNVTNYTAEGVLAVVGASVVGQTTADTILSFIPGLGWGAKAVTAGVITKGVGKLLVEYFYEHSTLPAY
jgi:uncharacterized protein (DUF697 family)